ncbi:THUMP domain-containing protein 1 homolog isoform X2 [Ischnura elegans]|uniref:THUMP domain-containing protein 1 homolog isoform X2 n=1 Tax=Ischnura elegans TaxID=197161 RepID=UPI001ED88700|nr:THUMP domain-containing protein 1 homolog isoform X2 [Ischnura elegans]
MSESQRGRSYNYKRKNYFRQNDNQRKRYDEFLEAGLKGFICTCNFSEDQCKREAYNILNEYSEKEEVEKPVPEEENVEEEDIEESLNKEVSALKAETSRGSRLMKFQNVKTGAKNCLFIRTTVEDPVKLVVQVLEDIESTKKHKSRHLLRMLPIEVTCKANPSSMEEAFKPLVKKHFSSEGRTFSVIYRARCNSSVSRGDIIELLAGLIKNAHPLNRADLDNPQLAVLVEIIKGICCIGVVPRYNELKRYNLHELVSPSGVKGGKGEGGEGQGDIGEKTLTTEGNGEDEEVALTSEDVGEAGDCALKVDPSLAVASENGKVVEGDGGTDDNAQPSKVASSSEDVGEAGDCALKVDPSLAVASENGKVVEGDGGTEGNAQPSKVASCDVEVKDEDKQKSETDKKTHDEGGE